MVGDEKMPFGRGPHPVLRRIPQFLPVKMYCGESFPIPAWKTLSSGRREYNDTYKLHTMASFVFKSRKVHLKLVTFLLFYLVSSQYCLLSTFRIGHQAVKFSTSPSSF